MPACYLVSPNLTPVSALKFGSFVINKGFFGFLQDLLNHEFQELTAKINRFIGRASFGKHPIKTNERMVSAKAPRSTAPFR